MGRLIYFLLIYNLFCQEDPTENMIISKQVFTIEGGTSLGNFTCTYAMSQKDTLLAYDSRISDKAVTYSIPSDKFACGNFLLNGDFRKTIKAKVYPYINVEISGFRKTNSSFTCDLKLKLAGKEKVYMNTPLKKEGQTITGDLMVRFSDFDLIAPKKMGGLVKVRENIKISIELTTLN